MPVIYTTEPNPFTSAKEFRDADDHIEMDISVSGWGKTLRIRSLTLPQRERINRHAGTGNDRDYEKFYAMTLVEGVVQPRLTPTDAAELVQYHNGETIEELGQAIWNLGALHRVYQQYREELKAVEDAKTRLADAEQERDGGN